MIARMLTILWLSTIAFGGAAPVCHFADDTDLGGGKRQRTIYSHPKYYLDGNGVYQPTVEAFALQADGTWLAAQGVHSVSAASDGTFKLLHRGATIQLKPVGFCILGADGTPANAWPVILANWALDASKAGTGTLTWTHAATGAQFEIRYVADGFRDRLILSPAMRAAMKAKLAAGATGCGIAFQCSMPAGLTRTVAGVAQIDHNTSLPIDLKAAGNWTRMRPAFIPNPADKTGLTGWQEKWRFDSATGLLWQTITTDGLDAVPELRTTVTYQQGASSYSGCTDTMMLSIGANPAYADYNYGSATGINVGSAASSSRKDRILVRFDLSALTGVTSVSSATLSLYPLAGFFYGSGPVAVSTARVLVSWGEGNLNGSTATAGMCSWNSCAYPTAWTTAGCSSLGNDRTAFANSLSVTNATQWFNWDIGVHASSWLVYGTANYGLLLQSDNEAQDEDTQFCSRDYTGDTTLRPKLTIIYSTAAAGGLPPVPNMDGGVNQPVLSGGMQQ